jgi:hypothetical protein
MVARFKMTSSLNVPNSIESRCSALGPYAHGIAPSLSEHAAGVKSNVFPAVKRKTLSDETGRRNVNKPPLVILATS